MGAGVDSFQGCATGDGNGRHHRTSRQNEWGEAGGERQRKCIERSSRIVVVIIVNFRSIGIRMLMRDAIEMRVNQGRLIVSGMDVLERRQTEGLEQRATYR